MIYWGIEQDLHGDVDKVRITQIRPISIHPGCSNSVIR